MTHHTPETAATALDEYSAQWLWRDNALMATFSFVNFTAAFAFMTKIAEVAEKMNHHPDWQNSYNRVSISLRTHDQNAVTNLDIALAKEISALAKLLI